MSTKRTKQYCQQEEFYGERCKKMCLGCLEVNGEDFHELKDEYEYRTKTKYEKL